MNAPTQLPDRFTAAQISAALGVHARQVYRWLGAVPPETELLINGKLTKAWALSALPGHVQTAIEVKARERGCCDAVGLPAVAPRRWQSPVPLDQLQQRFIDGAVKLREALTEPLKQQHTLEESKLVEFGLKEYARVFGHLVCSKTWNRLFDQVTDRDAGAGEWERVELYLSEKAFKKAKPKRRHIQLARLHDPLKEVVESLQDMTTPTDDDCAFLLDAVFRHFEGLLATNRDVTNVRQIKASLIAWLFSAVPGLSDSIEGLRKRFERAFARWQEKDRTHQALLDGRHRRSGWFRTPEFKEDLRKIRNEAILHGGNESLAHRKLRDAGQLSAEFRDHYSFDGRRNKSYVPIKVRAAITPEVDMCAAIHRGPWEAKMRGPYIPRNWNDTAPADWFSGDDVTWNSYFYYFDDRGFPWIGRGECLLLVDLRTGYPIEFLLVAGKYNGDHIRTLQLRGHNNVGFPHKGFYFEQSVWASRYVYGEDQRRHAIHFRETEAGFENLKLSLERRHATTPRAKPVEGIIRILQERQRNEPGFVGFNERIEKMERTQDFLRRCKSRQEHPGNELLSMEQWVVRIRETLDDFAHDPQNKKMLPGASPAEAWNEALTNRAPRKLRDDELHVLATRRQKVTVTEKGIILTIRGERLLYCNEETGKLVGHQIVANYNADEPDLLTCSDLNREHFFSVKRIELPAMTATKEQFAEANAAIRGHRQAAKVIYGDVQHSRVRTITRDDWSDDKTKELGRFHNGETERFKAEKTVRVRKVNRALETAAASGQVLNPAMRNPDRVLEGQKLEALALQRIAQKRSGSTAQTKGPG